MKRNLVIFLAAVSVVSVVVISNVVLHSEQSESHSQMPITMIRPSSTVQFLQQPAVEHCPPPTSVAATSPPPSQTSPVSFSCHSSSIAGILSSPSSGLQSISPFPSWTADGSAFVLSALYIAAESTVVVLVMPSKLIRDNITSDWVSGASYEYPKLREPSLRKDLTCTFRHPSFSAPAGASTANNWLYTTVSTTDLRGKASVIKCRAPLAVVAAALASLPCAAESLRKAQTNEPNAPSYSPVAVEVTIGSLGTFLVPYSTVFYKTPSSILRVENKRAKLGPVRPAAPPAPLPADAAGPVDPASVLFSPPECPSKGASAPSPDKGKVAHLEAVTSWIAKQPRIPANSGVVGELDPPPLDAGSVASLAGSSRLKDTLGAVILINQLPSYRSGSYLKQWVEWHRMLGADGFLLHVDPTTPGNDQSWQYIAQWETERDAAREAANCPNDSPRSICYTADGEVVFWFEWLDFRVIRPMGDIPAGGPRGGRKNISTSSMIPDQGYTTVDATVTILSSLYRLKDIGASWMLSISLDEYILPEEGNRTSFRPALHSLSPAVFPIIRVVTHSFCWNWYRNLPETPLVVEKYNWRTPHHQGGPIAPSREKIFVHIHGAASANIHGADIFMDRLAKASPFFSPHVLRFNHYVCLGSFRVVEGHHSEHDNSTFSLAARLRERLGMKRYVPKDPTQ